MCSAVHTKTHKTCLKFIHKSTNYWLLSIFFMKYVAVTPHYKNKNEEFKQTGSDSTIELSTDPHTAPLTVLTVLCRISVVCFGGELSVVFGWLWYVLQVCTFMIVCSSFRLIFFAL